MAQQSEWTPDEGPAPKKKGIPGWLWFCGIGCLLLFVVAAVGGFFVFRFAKDMVDPEKQWERLEAVVEIEDPRPEHLEMMFGWGLGMDMFWIVDNELGAMLVVFRLPADEAEQGRRQLMDPEVSGGAFGFGERKNLEAGTVEVQGRTLDVLRFDATGGQSTPDGREARGPSAMVDVTLEGAIRPVLVQITAVNTPEPLSDDEIRQVLAPFVIGPDR